MGDTLPPEAEFNEGVREGGTPDSGLTPELRFGGFEEAREWAINVLLRAGIFVREDDVVAVCRVTPAAVRVDVARNGVPYHILIVEKGGSWVPAGLPSPVYGR